MLDRHQTARARCQLSAMHGVKSFAVLDCEEQIKYSGREDDEDEDTAAYQLQSLIQKSRECF